MINMGNLGMHLKKKRGDKGIREVAKEIGISHATLSRIENGKLPDIETFKKICEWLTIDPGDILGVTSAIKKSEPDKFSVHLRANKNLNNETANALATMILSAQNMFMD